MKNTTIILAVTNDLTYDRRMFRICTALAGKGSNVILVGRQQKNSKSFQAEKFKSVRLKCWFNKRVWFYAEFNIRLFFFLIKTKYDISCSCDLDTALAVRFACRLKGKKSVFDAHEYFSEVPELKNRPFVKRIWEWIAKWTIPGFNLRYTVGEELAQLMGRQYGVPFHVIRNIAPVQAQRETFIDFEKRKNILLYQGALNVGRGLETCIEAMTQLPGWQLWLAGEGDITEVLKTIAKENRVGDRVIFLGWVVPEALPLLMQEAKLSINLREVDSLNDFYSLPNKFFDAIHAGLPSIHMNYPEYKNICTKYPCAILLDEVKVDAVVEAIHHIERHPEHWHSMSIACFEASKEYTWEKESSKLIQLYQELGNRK